MTDSPRCPKCGAYLHEAFYHEEWVGWRCRTCHWTTAYNPPSDDPSLKQETDVEKTLSGRRGPNA